MKLTVFITVLLTVLSLCFSLPSTRVFEANTTKATVDVDFSNVLHVTDDRFLSLGMDSNLIRDRWETFDFTSVRLKTLAKGLTPAYMRLMGTDGDRMIFVRDDLNQSALLEKYGGWPFPKTSFNMTSSDWDAINKWTADVGWRLLFGINAQTRRPLTYGNGTYWDASNALELLDYSVEKGYASNLDFEFGNEPDLWKKHAMAEVSGAQRAQEYLDFKKMLDYYYHPHFAKSLLAGPDTSKQGTDQNFITDFINNCGSIIQAVTFHQYYGGHNSGTIENSVNAKVLDSYIDYANEFIQNVRRSRYPDVAMWNGETSSAGSPPKPAGNEPDLWHSNSDFHGIPFTQLGQEFLQFKRILKDYYSTHFACSLLIGPDVAGNGGGGSIKDFLNSAGPVINATTFHQYYGGGGLNKIKVYIDPNMLDYYVADLKAFISNVQSSDYPHVTMWNGETSSTYSPPGNEPNIWFKGRNFIPVSPEQLGKEFKIFKRTLSLYGDNFRDAILVGPDVTGPNNYLTRFLNSCGDVINATSFHQYYGSGPHFNRTEDYLRPEVLDKYIASVKAVFKHVHASHKKHVPVWQGETSSIVSPPGNDIDETYVAGFMLLDKLGVSARLGLSLVVRQTFYGFWFALVDQRLEPRPNYWLSLMYKRLVGREVLDASVSMANNTNTPARLRLYANCVSQRSGYPQGSVVIYAMNLFNNSVNIHFNQSLAQGKVHVYLWTAPGGNLTSDNILLNGKEVNMVSDTELPELKPVIMKASEGVTMTNYSMAYYVFPDVKVKSCMKGFKEIKVTEI